MDALLLVDLQEGLLLGDAKHDLAAVLGRLDRLAGEVRRRGGRVVFVQHDGPPGDAFAPQAPGWRLLAAVRRGPADLTVRKTLNDPFVGTALEAELRRLGVDRVLVAGWATDLCVDATVRSATARGLEVVVVADGHTVSDRPHLPAAEVIAHHHWVWRHLLGPHPVRVVPAHEVYG